MGPDGGSDDRCRYAAAAAEPDGTEIHRTRPYHGSGEMSTLTDHSSQRASGSELTPADLRDLRRLAGLMIHAAAGVSLPGAEDEALSADTARSLGRDQNDVRKALTMLRELAGDNFAALVDAEAEATAMVLLRREVPEITALGRAVLQCYYRDDRVVRSLG